MWKNVKSKGVEQDFKTSEIYESSESDCMSTDAKSTGVNIFKANQGQKQVKRTVWLMLCIFSVSIGSALQLGITIASINRNKGSIEHFYNISQETFLIKALGRASHWGLITATYSIGGFLGAFIGRRLVDVIGRRNSLIINNIFVFIGGVLHIVAVNPGVLVPDILIAARFFTGINFGFTIVVGPMYLTEISPASMRGSIGLAQQLGLNFGILLALTLGLPEIFGEFVQWPFLFGAHLAIIPLQLFTLPFCPKSPRYLLMNCRDISAADIALRKLRGSGYDTQEEITQMKEELLETQERMSLRELLSSRLLRKPLALSVFGQLIQQTNGMVVIFAYSNIIFESVGLPKEMSGRGSVGLAGSYILGALLCSFVVDHFGKRSLFLTGLPLQAIAFTLLTVTFVVGNPEVKGDWSGYVGIVVMNSVLFFACLYVGLIWTFSAELFTQGPRPAAMGFCSMCNRFFNFTLIFLFPTLRVALQKYIFLLFAGLCTLYAIGIYIYFPETRNKTFLDLQRELFGEKVTKAPSEQEIITDRVSSL